MRIQGTHGKTLLHITARRNLSGICRWLLRHGVDVNRTDILDRTALHHAAQCGATDTARLLIAHGADIGAKDWQGRTPFDLARASDSTANIIHEKISLRHTHHVKTVKALRDRKKKRRGWE